MNYHHYYKRDPIKNYFPLPNEIFSLGLSFGEIAVYAYLMHCKDRKNLPVLSELQHHRAGDWHEQKDRCQVRQGA